ncbi:hypothetical protein QBA54_00915 [Streptomyces sp. B21-108]|uniref:hypothetical protein n=1 Tax=Streptomyces sp. B21-108 TaxID=3039419 RepID=UPI002FF21D07
MASTVTTRALVLGGGALVLGGGVTGMGWEVGVPAGLLDEGVDLRDADTVIGTSAGLPLTAVAVTAVFVVVIIALLGLLGHPRLPTWVKMIVFVTVPVAALAWLLVVTADDTLKDPGEDPCSMYYGGVGVSKAFPPQAYCRYEDGSTHDLATGTQFVFWVCFAIKPGPAVDRSGMNRLGRCHGGERGGDPWQRRRTRHPQRRVTRLRGMLGVPRLTAAEGGGRGTTGAGRPFLSTWLVEGTVSPGLTYSPWGRSFG